jgi:hypothetical protein
MILCTHYHRSSNRRREIAHGDLRLSLLAWGIGVIALAFVGGMWVSLGKFLKSVVMEKFVVDEDLHLFGNRVNSFPVGIKESFDGLIAMLPEGLERDYYGVSWMEGEAVIYYTMAAEKFAGESNRYACEMKLDIGKGEYLGVTVRDWMSKTDSIKDVFDGLMKDKRVVVGAPCVEWYKSDEEMVCMMKLRE